jgi:hypothetical protein
MLGWLLGARKQGSPVTERDRLNDDLAAYVRTFPMVDRLREHLASQNRSGELTSVQAMLDLAVADTGDFLYAQSTPIRWNSEFEQALFHHVSVRHAWLTHDGFAPLNSYAGWLSWHEGLSAS